MCEKKNEKVENLGIEHTSINSRAFVVRAEILNLITSQENDKISVRKKKRKVANLRM